MIGTTFYGPILARGGSEGEFSVVIDQLRGHRPVFACQVEHRDKDSRDWETAATTSPFSAPGMTTLVVRDLREEIRVAYVLGPGATGSFKPLRPVWRP